MHIHFSSSLKSVLQRTVVELQEVESQRVNGEAKVNYSLREMNSHDQIMSFIASND